MNRSSRRTTLAAAARHPMTLIVVAGAMLIVGLGASGKAQDTQRLRRLELTDAEGAIRMVLDVSPAGTPRVSVIDGGDASIFEFGMTELRIVSPREDQDDEGATKMNVSTIRFDALHALVGSVAAGDPATEAEIDSITLRMRYLQEQINALEREQNRMERDMEAAEPRGRDVRDPLRLQRVIDDLQRDIRDLENDTLRSSRDIDDLERRVRSIEMKIRLTATSRARGAGLQVHAAAFIQQLCARCARRSASM